MRALRAAGALLAEVSAREHVRRPWRAALAVGAVTLGVTVFAAARTATSSLGAALRDTVDRIAGEAQLEVTAGEAGLPEDALWTVRGVPGVRAAAPVVSAVVTTGRAGEGSLLVLGVDLAGDAALRSYSLAGPRAVEDPLALLRRADGLLVAADFAARRGLRQGDRLALLTAAGAKSFTVCGILEPRGPARAFGGNLAVMSLGAAQRAFGRGRRLDRIDVAVAPGFAVERARAGLERALGPGYRVAPPARRGLATEGLLAAFARLLDVSSAMALLVGTFLVFNASTAGIAERRGQIGVVRALGATRHAVQGWLVAESLALGAAGAALGALAGLVLGRVVLAGMAAAVERIYGVAVAAGPPAAEPRVLAASCLAGLAAAALGAWLPARDAARLDPAAALRRGEPPPGAPRRERRRRLAGVLCLAAALAAAGAGWGRALVPQLVLLAFLFAGVTLLVPTLSRLAVVPLRRPLERLFGIAGRLAADGLARAPRRTSATVTALLLCLAFAVASASLSAGIRASLRAWVETTVNPDLLVLASPSLTARSFRFPAAMGRELAEVPGVRQVEGFRVAALDSGRSPVLVALDFDLYFRRARPIFEEGSAEQALPALLSGGGLLVSNNYARLHGVGRGDRVVLATPAGRRELVVAGVLVDYTSESGALFLDRRVYARLWRDDGVDLFELMLTPGREPAEVRAAIYRRFAGRRTLFVLTNRDVRDEVLRLADRFWALTYVQLLVAAAVAVAGIAHSLAVSVAERRRELAIVRALGGRRRDVRRAVVLEALAVGAVALALGVAFGATLGSFLVSTAGDAIGGWVFPYRFPTRLVLALVPAVLAVCAAAAWLPAARAAAAPIAGAVSRE